MEATAISHIAICTRDIEKSLTFYRDLLGMQVLFDGQTSPKEGGRPHNYQQARQGRRRVSLAFAQGAKPTLTITSHPGEEIAGAPLQLDQLGITHFSFTVPNAEALLDELLAKGVQLAGPREAFVTAEGRTRTFYVYDPDGIIIQFDSGLDEGLAPRE
jgi:catechol 2,3-dioxygenase-like lactoylglutathione lyase family enzyme